MSLSFAADPTSLASNLTDAVKGKKLAPGVAYLARPGVLTAKSTGKLDLEDIDQAWACVATNLTKKVAADYDKAVKSGQSKELAMEGCSQGRFVAAKVRSRCSFSCLSPSLVTD